MAKRYWTYIVASKTGTLYVGMTNDLYKRVYEHKNHLVEGFTSKYDCTRLVWYEEFGFVDNAIRLEKQIKGWTRAKKIALIENENPRWEDIAENWGSQMLMRNESIRDREKALRVKLPVAAPVKEM